MRCCGFLEPLLRRYRRRVGHWRKWTTLRRHAVRNAPLVVTLDRRHAGALAQFADLTLSGDVLARDAAFESDLAAEMFEQASGFRWINHFGKHMAFAPVTCPVISSRICDPPMIDTDPSSKLPVIAMTKHTPLAEL